MALCRFGRQVESQERFASIAAEAVVLQAKEPLIVRGCRAGQGSAAEDTGERGQNDERHPNPADTLEDPCLVLDVEILIKIAYLGG